MGELEDILYDVENTVQSLNSDLNVLQEDLKTVSQNQRKKETWNTTKKAKQTSRKKITSPLITKRDKKKTSRNESTPGAGAYHPDYSLVQRNIPGFRIVPVTIPRKRRVESQTELKTSVLSPRAHSRAITATRSRNVPSFSFAPPKVVRPHHQTKNIIRKRKPDNSPGFKYNPDFSVVQKSIPGYVFGPQNSKVKRVMAENEDSDSKSASSYSTDDQLLDVERALQATFPRAKGGLIGPKPKTTSRLENQKCSEGDVCTLDIGLSLNATKPRVIGGYFGAPRYSKPTVIASTKPESTKPSENLEESTEGVISRDLLGEVPAAGDGDDTRQRETVIEPKVTTLTIEVVPKGQQPLGFKRHETKILKRFRKHKKTQMTRLGPGSYGNPSGDTARKAILSQYNRTNVGVPWKLQQERKKHKKQSGISEEVLGPGYYDSHISLDRTKKRVTSFAALGRRKDIELQKQQTVLVRKTRIRKLVKRTTQSTKSSKERVLELASKLEESSLEESEEEGSGHRQFQKIKQKSYRKERERKESSSSEWETYSRSSSSVSDNDSDDEEIKKWIQSQREKYKQRRERYEKLVQGARANPDDPDEVESVYEEVEYIVGGDDDPDIALGGPASVPRSRITRAVAYTKERVKGVMAWGQPSAEDSSSSKARKILKRHRAMKEMEVKGPSRIVKLNHSAVEKQAPMPVPESVAMEARRKQNLKNDEIQRKIRMNGNAESRLLSKLGIDPTLFETESAVESYVGPQLQANWVCSPTAGEKGRRRPVFKYRTENPKPTALIRARMLEKAEEENIGPGKYATQMHKNWADQSSAKSVQEAHSQWVRSKVRVEKATTEKEKLEALEYERRAKNKLNKMRSQEIMSKTKGRETIRAKKKGAVEIWDFGDPNGAPVGGRKLEEYLRQIGPGYYEVPNNITRFGKDEPKIWLKLDKMSSNHVGSAAVELGDDGDVLFLDPTVSPTRNRPPGSKAFTFAQAGMHGDQSMPVQNQKEQAGEQLDLEPNYLFGKFYEPQASGGYIDFSRQQGRPTAADDLIFEVQNGDEMLMLSPQRGDKYLQRRVKSGVPFDKSTVREISEISQKREGELYRDAQYDVSKAESAIRPRVRQVRIDDGVQGGLRSRFEDGVEERDVAFDAEYDVQRGERYTKLRTGNGIGEGLGMQVAPDISKQLGRGDRAEEVVEEQRMRMLSTPNETVRSEPSDAYTRPKGPYVINMEKSAPRWQDEKVPSGPILELDQIERGEQVMTRASRVPSGVAMDKQLGRAEIVAKDKAGGDIGGDEAVVQGEHRLSTCRARPMGNLDFDKQLGRAYDAGKADDGLGLDLTLRLDPEKIANAPSQVRRVTGGVISRAESGPKTDYGRAVEQQGNVLVLEPKDESLRPRVKTMIDIDKHSSRVDATQELLEAEKNPRGFESTLMASPPRPDIHKSFVALKQEIPGGDSVLKPPARQSNPGVLKKQQLDRDLEKQMKKLSITEAKTKLQTEQDSRRKVLDRVTGVAGERKAMKKAKEEFKRKQELLRLAKRREKKKPKGKARWVG